jgi:hypothetical protein
MKFIYDSGTVLSTLASFSTASCPTDLLAPFSWRGVQRVVAIARYRCRRLVATAKAPRSHGMLTSPRIVRCEAICTSICTSVKRLAAISEDKQNQAHSCNPSFARATVCGTIGGQPSVPFARLTRFTGLSDTLLRRVTKLKACPFSHSNSASRTAFHGKFCTFESSLWPPPPHHPTIVSPRVPRVHRFPAPRSVHRIVYKRSFCYTTCGRHKHRYANYL